MKKSKRSSWPVFSKRFIRRAQAFADPHDVFVVNRKDNRRADAGNALAAIFLQPRDAAFVAEHPQYKTIQAMHATDGNEQKQNDEQNQQHRADADQPLRQSKSAKSIETTPVSSTARE